MGSHEITHLIHQYGLLLIFAVVALQALGAPLPGTTALVAGALYAATGHGLPIVGVIAAGVAGALCGTCLGFTLGRLGGERLLLRAGRLLRQPPWRVHRLRVQFAAHGGSWLLFGRFITGVRNVTGLLAGASGMAFGRFLGFSAIAAFAWATINGLEYYWFGHALAAADTWLQVVLVAAGLLTLWLSFRVLRRRAGRSLASWEQERLERVAARGGE